VGCASMWCPWSGTLRFAHIKVRSPYRSALTACSRRQSNARLVSTAKARLAGSLRFEERGREAIYSVCPLAQTAAAVRGKNVYFVDTSTWRGGRLRRWNMRGRVFLIFRSTRTQCPLQFEGFRPTSLDVTPMLGNSVTEPTHSVRKGARQRAGGGASGLATRLLPNGRQKGDARYLATCFSLSKPEARPGSTTPMTRSISICR
jgi:hypothetical protein